jgi:hypothetical protein
LVLLAQSHYRHHQQQPLLPLLMTTIAAATQLTAMTIGSQRLVFVVNGGNGGPLPHSRQ